MIDRHAIFRIHLGVSSDVMSLVLDSAEAFSIASIKRCSLLTNSQREVILRSASSPRTLKHLVRLSVRHIMGDIGQNVIERINLLPIPGLIKRYLLYEI